MLAGADALIGGKDAALDFGAGGIGLFAGQNAAFDVAADFGKLVAVNRKIALQFVFVHVGKVIITRIGTGGTRISQDRPEDVTRHQSRQGAKNNPDGH